MVVLRQEDRRACLLAVLGGRVFEVDPVREQRVLLPSADEGLPAEVRPGVVPVQGRQVELGRAQSQGVRVAFRGDAELIRVGISPVGEVGGQL